MNLALMIFLIIIVVQQTVTKREYALFFAFARSKFDTTTTFLITESTLRFKQVLPNKEKKQNGFRIVYKCGFETKKCQTPVLMFNVSIIFKNFNLFHRPPEFVQFLFQEACTCAINHIGHQIIKNLF